jgi:hypothetical protein
MGNDVYKGKPAAGSQERKGEDTNQNQGRKVVKWERRGKERVNDGLPSYFPRLPCTVTHTTGGRKMLVGELRKAKENKHT